MMVTYRDLSGAGLGDAHDTTATAATNIAVIEGPLACQDLAQMMCSPYGGTVRDPGSDPRTRQLLEYLYEECTKYLGSGGDVRSRVEEINRTLVSASRGRYTQAVLGGCDWLNMAKDRLGKPSFPTGLPAPGTHQPPDHGEGKSSAGTVVPGVPDPLVFAVIGGAAFWVLSSMFGGGKGR